MYDRDPVTHGSCKVTFDAEAGPQILNQTGEFLSVARKLTIAAGITIVTLGDDYNIGLDECYPEVTLRDGTLAGSDAPSYSITQLTPATFQICTVREAAMGGASILADINYDLNLRKKRATG